MAVLDLFSKRQKRLRDAGKQEIYQYEVLPSEFRVQVVHILRDAIGVYFVPGPYSSGTRSPANNIWQMIHDRLARERGVFQLWSNGSDPADSCMQFMLRAEVDGVLDIIELSFRAVDRAMRKMDLYSRNRAGAKQDPDDAIGELNARFKEHGIGFQYLNEEIVRIDSQFLHQEAVKPALNLLNAPGFDGPSDEFMKAFEHYRHSRPKEAIADALKAFESVMKSICAIRNWAHPPNATAKPLLDILFQNGLIPRELEGHFSGLRAALESGLPTISNRTSRHGQGVTPTEVPGHIAAHALHLTAANIVFLVEAHKSLP